MKKFLAFLFLALIFSATMQPATAGMKEDLKPGIEFVQGQIEASVYEVINASPAVIFVQDKQAVMIPVTMVPETLYNNCRKTLLTASLNADYVNSPGICQEGSFKGFTISDIELSDACSKRLSPGTLSLERCLRDKRYARQRAILNRKFPG